MEMDRRKRSFIIAYSLRVSFARRSRFLHTRNRRSVDHCRIRYTSDDIFLNAGEVGSLHAGYNCDLHFE
jgi:hypothetical protein